MTCLPQKAPVRQAMADRPLLTAASSWNPIFVFFIKNRLKNLLFQKICFKFVK